MNPPCVIDLIGNAFTVFVFENQMELWQLHRQTEPDVPFPVFCYIQFAIEYERLNEE
jgi:hypothetical protein